MTRRPPTSTRTATLFPDTTLCRSVGALAQRRPHEEVVGALDQQENGEEDGAVEKVDRFDTHGRLSRERCWDRRCPPAPGCRGRSEEHTSELQSLMRISYAVFCLKKTTQKQTTCHRKPHHRQE